MALSKDFSLSQYARAAGVMLLISFVGGALGEFFILSKLMVRNDAAATATNIRASEFLFRFGFAAYLFEAICDVALLFVFYKLLSPVHKGLAQLTVLLGMVSMITFAFAEFFYYATTLVLADSNYLKTFSKEQLESLSYLLLRFYGQAGGLFLIFYGLASIIRGYLIFHSGYIPKMLGVLLIIGGTGFVLRTFILVLFPAYVSNYYMMPMVFTILCLGIWFTLKGVNENAVAGKSTQT
jgi:hypothetical protein